MPITNVAVRRGFSATSTDTLVDVIPCWGYIWTIYTDKVCRYTYASGGGSEILAYTFAPASTGELIQSAFPYNGYMYLGTTCPAHASDARILRLEPTSADNISDLLTTNGAFLTATAELSISTADANEHSILGFCTCGNTMLACYQYQAAGVDTMGIERQDSHGNWSQVANRTVIGAALLDPFTPATVRAQRWMLMQSGVYAFSFVVRAVTTGYGGYYQKNEIGQDIANAAYVTTVNAGQYNIGRAPDGWFFAADDSLVYSDDGRYQQGALTRRVLNGTQLWYEGYGSSATLSPAFISDINWYGGVPWFDNYFAGIQIVEDDGSAVLTTYYAIAYRTPDGGWVITNKEASSATNAAIRVPKWRAMINDEPVLLAPHVGESNFSIIFPEYAGSTWTRRTR